MERIDTVTETEVAITRGGVRLEGTLAMPERAAGLAVFAHGSGSGRFSSRNRHVARRLQEQGVATLLFDLLTEDEERVDRETAEHRFDIELLTSRLVLAIDWLRDEKVIDPSLPIGCFGASTGAAAAIRAAVERPDHVAAVVSRGGRPDLAGDALGRLGAPTLLIVGGADEQVLQLNRQARARMTQARSHLAIVPGATHLFEEPGTLDRAADLAAEWLGTTFRTGSPPAMPGGSAPRSEGRELPERFADRLDAGHHLAERLRTQLDDADLENAIVVGMPRGGVPIGRVVADKLELPLTIVVVRKVGAPGHPEYGIGAVAEDGVAVIDERAARLSGATDEVLERLVAHELVETERRRRAYLGEVAADDFTGRHVIVIDDGLATGVTALAAGRLLRRRRAAKLTLAVPVCAADTARKLADEYDQVVCLHAPEDFGAVSLWYDRFGQTSDEEVVQALKETRGRVRRQT